jgi:hypothetical protein
VSRVRSFLARVAASPGAASGCALAVVIAAGAAALSALEAGPARAEARKWHATHRELAEEFEAHASATGEAGSSLRQVQSSSNR